MFSSFIFDAVSSCLCERNFCCSLSSAHYFLSHIFLVMFRDVIEDDKLCLTNMKRSKWTNVFMLFICFKSQQLRNRLHDWELVEYNIQRWIFKMTDIRFVYISYFFYLIIILFSYLVRLFACLLLRELWILVFFEYLLSDVFSLTIWCINRRAIISLLKNKSINITLFWYMIFLSLRFSMSSDHSNFNRSIDLSRQCCIVDWNRFVTKTIWKLWRQNDDLSSRTIITLCSWLRLIRLCIKCRRRMLRVF